MDSDKEKQNVSMKEMLTKRSFEPITNCNCKGESRIDYAVRKNEDNAGAFVNLLNQEINELLNNMEQGMQIRICNACKQYKKCDKELCTMSRLVAEELSRFYQPKLEDSVVLSREEYEVLKIKEKEKHWLETCMSIWKNARIDSSKETAEKIWERGKEFYFSNEDKDFAFNEFADWIETTFIVRSEKL